MTLTSLVLTAILGVTESSGSAAVHPCGPSDGLNFICGPTASEDLALIPGTRWLVASGLNTGAASHLYLIDSQSKTAAPAFPTSNSVMRLDPALRTGCAGPPNLAEMSMDGINIRPGKGAQHMLYAANHGDRHAIEMFKVDASQSTPTVSWVGCATMPEGTLANAVVPLADGGFIVNSFYDPRDKQAWERMDRGESTGSVWEWHAGAGFHRLDIGPVSGANGIALSADEQTLYVSAWSGGALVIFNRKTAARREISLGFLPDNIKRAPDGTLFIGGQRSKVAEIAACRATCPQNWVIANVDPAHDTVKALITRPGNALINYACGALQVGDTLYITARGDHRLAYVPVASLPSLH